MAVSTYSWCLNLIPRESIQRTKTSDQFRTVKQGILFSSDVSARGVDYPDITMVLQVRVVQRGGGLLYALMAPLFEIDS